MRKPKTIARFLISAIAAIGLLSWVALPLSTQTESPLVAALAAPLDLGAPTWIEAGLTNADVRVLVIDHTNPVTIYAASRGVLKTTDGGANWKNVGLSSDPVVALAINHSTPNILYASINLEGGCSYYQRRVFKSTDGGATWAVLTPDINGCDYIDSLVVDPANPSTLYLADFDHLFGDTWAPLMKSTDGGSSWAPPSFNPPFACLIVDPLQPRTLYAGTFDFPYYGYSGWDYRNGVFKSTDGGENWGTTGLKDTGVNFLAVDPLHPTTLYAATSSFGGYPSRPNGFRGLFKSTDAGATWFAINNGLSHLIGGVSSVSALVIDPDSPSILYAGTGGGGVFKSTDAGASWHDFSKGLTNLGIRTLALVPGNPNTLYAGTSGGVFKIIDRVPAPTNAIKGKIAFTSDRDGNPEIYVMNPDGTNQTRLTNNSSVDEAPAWSPDGTRIAFTSTRDGNLEIYLMNADGSNQTRLTNNLVLDFAPAWSPDGNRIAFAREQIPGGFTDIYLMNADGSNQTRITFDSLVYAAPNWSPDGKKIVFMCHGNICVMNADGSSRATLAKGDLFHGFSEPSWSPDGNKIAYSSFPIINDQWDDPTEIYVMNADGSQQQNLTQTPDTKERAPAWSPDASKLVFSVWNNSYLDQGASEIFTMNSDGSGRMQLTNTPGLANRQPSWQPLASVACPNPIDCPEFFVRQHYRDFLNREADAEGLAFWTNSITSCGADQQCIDAKRVNVSAAFFLSIEFQQTGYLVYRMYKAAYGNLPNAPVPIRFSEFLLDTQEIGSGLIVGQTGWQAVLENNKEAFAADSVQRSRFASAFPTSMTPGAFVDMLFANAGVTPSSSDRAAAINEFGSASTTADVSARARALRRVAENPTLVQQELNRAFVLMQYFGYLRRNPNDAPDANFDGYNFWLNKLNAFNGDYNGAEMVKAFISSREYRSRFGS